MGTTVKCHLKFYTLTIVQELLWLQPQTSTVEALLLFVTRVVMCLLHLSQIAVPSAALTDTLSAHFCANNNITNQLTRQLLTVMSVTSILQAGKKLTNYSDCTKRTGS